MYHVKSCLAYNIILQIWPENEIGAIIVVPSRELAKQVGVVCKSFADALSLSMRVMIGGKKAKCNLKTVHPSKFVLFSLLFIKAAEHRR